MDRSLRAIPATARKGHHDCCVGGQPPPTHGVPAVICWVHGGLKRPPPKHRKIHKEGRMEAAQDDCGGGAVEN